MLHFIVNYIVPLYKAMHSLSDTGFIVSTSMNRLSWWLHWLSVGLVIERSQVQLLAGALSSQLGQLSLPSLRGR